MTAGENELILMEFPAERPPMVRDTSPAGLIALAVETGADVDKLEKLMDLHERWTLSEARKAFNTARARFQATCPEITKDREANTGKFKYKYASFGAVMNQIRKPLTECGLSVRFEVGESDHGMISVRCILCHVDGHCESNAMSALPDDSGAKNSIQQRGSTITYLQRYTLIGALGISTANDDDDGQSGGQTNVEDLRHHNDIVRNWLDTIVAVKTYIGTGQLEQAIEAWLEVPDDDKRVLWVAPSKGGMFTTQEREVMKGGEWAELRRAMVKGEPE